MVISEMSDSESRDLLARLASGRLACARDNQPYITPIYFVYESNHFYCFATVGQKIEWMRLNPRVCIQADEIRSHFEWKSVVVLGRYEELPNDAEHKKAHTHAITLLANRSLWWQAAYATDQLRRHSGDPTPAVYCVHIEAISGHRADPDATEVRMEIAPVKGG